MSDIRAKITAVEFEKIKTNEQRKVMTFQLLGATVASMDKTKRKIEEEIERMSLETETAIKTAIVKNNIAMALFRFKEIDFQNGELVFEEKPKQETPQAGENK